MCRYPPSGSSREDENIAISPPAHREKKISPSDRTKAILDLEASPQVTRFGPKRVAADMEGNGKFDF